MTTKEEFLKEKERCEIPFTHIEKGITDSSLKKIDEMFGAADVLSIKNSKNHKNNLLITSILASLLVLFFVIYEAAEQHYMIFPCLVLIALLFYNYKKSRKQKAHEKYLEYRLLAETLRVHYFLTIAKVKTPVYNILPWFLHRAVPWIREVLKELPEPQLSEKRPIINCWIEKQEEYHNTAHVNTRAKKEKDDRIEKIALAITISGYVAAGIFELYLFLKFPLDGEITHLIRACLKIIIGIGTVITFFLGNYYGTISLSSKIEEHRRMSQVYQKSKNRILQQGDETEELLVHLAREFLIENATWYAHQKENKIEFSVE